MVKSKLITLLKTFSKDEMKEFDKFILSPYFSKGRNLKPLYNILKKYHPLFDSPNLTEEKIFRKLYPQKKFERKSSLHSLRVLVSDMTGLAEKFLIYNSFERGDRQYYRDNNLIYLLMERHLNNYALKVSFRVSEKLDELEKTRHYYYERMGMNEYISSLYTLKLERDNSFEYKKRDITALYAFIFDKVCGLINDYVNREHNFNKKEKGFSLLKNIISSFDIKEFEKECQDDEFNTKSFVLMNYHISRALIEKENTEGFESSLKYYYLNFNKFSKQNKFTFYAFLNTICNTRMTSDFEYYGRAGHKLSDLFLKKEIYDISTDAHLPATFYNSLLNYKIAFLDADGFKKFIDSNLEKIKSINKDTLYCFSYAIYYFKTKDFIRSLEYFSRIKTIIQPLKSKILQWKIAALYEAGYFEDAINSIDSFEHYARNNPNISVSIKNLHLNFANSIKKMINIKISGLYEERVLVKIINSNINTTFKYWFKEKTEEILCRDQN